MKIKHFFISLICTCMVQSTSAALSINVTEVPTQVSIPTNGFSVKYRLFGSKSGAGAASAELKFYLSTTQDGSSGATEIYSSQILLNGSGLGPYTPPSGEQTVYLSRISAPDTLFGYLIDYLVDNTCSSTWYIIGKIDTNVQGSFDSIEFIKSDQTPDLYFSSTTFTSNVSQGCTGNLNFIISTLCPASLGSEVGVYIADNAYNVLAYIGGISLQPGSGNFSTGNIPINFSPILTPGSYAIILYADQNQVVSESNENNNIVAIHFSISAPASTSTANLNAPLNEGMSSTEKVATLSSKEALVGIDWEIEAHSLPIEFMAVQQHTHLPKPTIEWVGAHKKGLKVTFPINGGWDNSFIVVYDQYGKKVLTHQHEKGAIATVNAALKSEELYIVKVLTKGQKPINHKIYITE